MSLILYPPPRSMSSPIRRGKPPMEMGAQHLEIAAQMILLSVV